MTPVLPLAVPVGFREPRTATRPTAGAANGATSWRPMPLLVTRPAAFAAASNAHTWWKIAVPCRPGCRANVSCGDAYVPVELVAPNNVATTSFWTKHGPELPVLVPGTGNGSRRPEAWLLSKPSTEMATAFAGPSAAENVMRQRLFG